MIDSTGEALSKTLIHTSETLTLHRTHHIFLCTIGEKTPKFNTSKLHHHTKEPQHTVKTSTGKTNQTKSNTHTRKKQYHHQSLKNKKTKTFQIVKKIKKFKFKRVSSMRLSMHNEDKETRLCLVPLPL